LESKKKTNKKEKMRKNEKNKETILNKTKEIRVIIEIGEYPPEVLLVRALIHILFSSPSKS
jgi:hypothetical protein